MIAPNPSTPWVMLVVLVMVGCALSGMLMGNVGPFNPHVAEANIPILQTKAAQDWSATQSAQQIAQTQQAPMVAATALAGNLTLIPLQQAAAVGAATQTMAADQIYNARLLAQATQTTVAQNLGQANVAATSFAQQQRQQQASWTAQIGMLVVGVLLVASWITIRLTILFINARVQEMNARAQEKEAQAKLLAEQRQLAALRASIEAQKRERATKYPTPLSLMKKPGNGKDLPRGE